MNDVFFLADKETKLAIIREGAHVEIYNRWGSLVFQTEAYNNTDNYWDGYSQGDKNHKLPVGVYYYVIDLGIPDIENIFTGSIYLNR